MYEPPRHGTPRREHGLINYLAPGHNANFGQAAGYPLQRQVGHLLEGHMVRQHVPRDVVNLLHRPHTGSLVENAPNRL